VKDVASGSGVHHALGFERIGFSNALFLPNVPGQMSGVCLWGPPSSALPFSGYNLVTDCTCMAR
jgi:hypothetical protein